MNRTIGILAMTLLTAAANCNGQPAASLIGAWKIGPAQNKDCPTPLAFTDKEFTSRDAKGKVATLPVTYTPGINASQFPVTVYVKINGAMANHMTFRIMSSEFMLWDGALQCRYQRG
jgi:hypothetical protein